MGRSAPAWPNETPAADVQGHDTVAKMMILSALVFGRQLSREQVPPAAASPLSLAKKSARRCWLGGLRHAATSAFSGPDGKGPATARVQPEVVPAGDLLAGLDGVTNAVVCQASSIEEVTIIGPGAGAQPAGQGVLRHIVAVARWQTRNS